MVAIVTKMGHWSVCAWDNDVYESNIFVVPLAKYLSLN